MEMSFSVINPQNNNTEKQNKEKSRAFTQNNMLPPGDYTFLTKTHQKFIFSMNILRYNLFSSHCEVID